VAAIGDALADVEALNARTNRILDDAHQARATMGLLVNELRRPDLVKPSRLLVRHELLAECRPSSMALSRVGRRRPTLVKCSAFLLNDLLVLQGAHD